MRMEQGKNPAAQSLYYAFKEKVTSMYVYIYEYACIYWH